MLILRKSDDRGRGQMPWLNSFHTFSFADYHDTKWTSFGPLRVINEDFIQANTGFDMHPHRDMEIITYLISGALKHEDNLGNGSIIIPGDIQRMSAGTGVLHSEFNHSNKETLHLLQIWILPAKKGIAPGYEQKKINQTLNQLILIASNHPTEHAVTIHQDAQIFVGFFEKDKCIEHSLNQQQAWIQVIKGRLQINNQELNTGDGLGILDEDQLTIHCIDNAEFLLFELKK